MDPSTGAGDVCGRRTLPQGAHRSPHGPRRSRTATSSSVHGPPPAVRLRTPRPRTREPVCARLYPGRGSSTTSTGRMFDAFHTAGLDA